MELKEFCPPNGNDYLCLLFVCFFFYGVRDTSHPPPHPSTCGGKIFPLPLAAVMLAVKLVSPFTEFILWKIFDSQNKVTKAPDPSTVNRTLYREKKIYSKNMAEDIKENTS